MFKNHCFILPLVNEAKLPSSCITGNVKHENFFGFFEWYENDDQVEKNLYLNFCVVHNNGVD